MPVSVFCPSCGVKMKAPDHAVGHTIKCPKCASTVPVPANAAPVPAPVHHSAAPVGSGTVEEPTPRKKGGGCCGFFIFLMLLLSFAVNLGAIGGVFYIGYTDSWDQLPKTWNQVDYLKNLKHATEPAPAPQPPAPQ